MNFCEEPATAAKMPLFCACRNSKTHKLGVCGQTAAANSNLCDWCLRNC